MEKCTYFQFCYKEGGELVTIMDNSKQNDVKRFIKDQVRYLWLPETYMGIPIQLWKQPWYFWTGGHS